VLSFASIVLRDLVVMAIMCAFIWKVTKDKNHLEITNRETHITLYDFSQVVLSVMPLHYFDMFLERHHPKLTVCLKIVKLHIMKEG
jgi:hypothetical protein